MNLAELEAALGEAGISESAYSFTSDGIGEVYRLQHTRDAVGEAWEVYYTERGNRNYLVVFRSETEACDHLLRWILHDPTIRRPSPPQQQMNCQ